MTEVQSMTGFASATHVGDGLEASCDIRSVNNKGLDIRLRLPGGLEALEAAIKKLVGDRLALRSTGGEVPDSAVAEAPGVVVACSALKRSYRDRLRARAPHTVFVHLTGDPELLSARALARTGHFMPPALLASQLATLEPLGDDEAGVVVDVTEAVATVAERAVGWVQREGSE